MKRNILLVTIALLIISLIAVGTSYGIGRYRAATAKATTFEELHKACEKNPQMQKMMEQVHGKDAKKHHDQMGEQIKDHMGNGDMMSGSMH